MSSVSFITFLKEMIDDRISLFVKNEVKKQMKTQISDVEIRLTEVVQKMIKGNDKSKEDTRIVYQIPDAGRHQKNVRSVSTVVSKRIASAFSSYHSTEDIPKISIKTALD